MESHWNSLGFGNCGALGGEREGKRTNCKFASIQKADGYALQHHENKLTWYDGDTLDGFGIVTGADYGFFRLEIEGTYQDSGATSWREHDATSGTVHQARIFANVVAEPFDLLALMGEYGGVTPLVKYNPATYGISPYAMVGYGVMGGLLEDLGYTRDCVLGGGNNGTTSAGGCKEEGAYAGGATPAINTGAGVNIGLDSLAKGFSNATGTSLPDYFKLPIEISIGYHWQISNDQLLWESIDEDLAIDDGGLTYSIGLKW